MPLFPNLDEDALFLSRSNLDEPLSSYAKYEFHLDGKDWPSVEHYYQAMKFNDADYQDKIRRAPHPKKARRWGRSRFKKLRKDWKDVREVVMTRAVYIKCRTHEEVAQQLLDTGTRKIVERSLYDYYWGCGRDGRGANTYGKVLMNVRGKLMQEQNSANR